MLITGFYSIAGLCHCSFHWDLGVVYSQLQMVCITAVFIEAWWVFSIPILQMVCITAAYYELTLFMLRLFVSIYILFLNMDTGAVSKLFNVCWYILYRVEFEKHYCIWNRQTETSILICNMMGRAPLRSGADLKWRNSGHHCGWQMTKGGTTYNIEC
jgi:hypothetical protein